MNSLWNHEDTAAISVGDDIAQRVYSSRLLGRENPWCCMVVAIPPSS